jgi:hypothetical protein
MFLPLLAVQELPAALLPCLQRCGGGGGGRGKGVTKMAMYQIGNLQPCTQGRQRIEIPGRKKPLESNTPYVYNIALLYCTVPYGIYLGWKLASQIFLYSLHTVSHLILYRCICNFLFRYGLGICHSAVGLRIRIGTRFSRSLVLHFSCRIRIPLHVLKLHNNFYVKKQKNQRQKCYTVYYIKDNMTMLQNVAFLTSSSGSGSLCNSTQRYRYQTPLTRTNDRKKSWGTRYEGSWYGKSWFYIFFVLSITFIFFAVLRIRIRI